MDFKDTQAIYMQIADLICDNIVTGKWKEGERIPSVREFGVQLEVNPNTVMRAYDGLQGKEVIYNKRGIGYFVGEGARRKILTEKRTDFMEKELPLLFRRMYLLDVLPEDIISAFSAYRKKREEKKEM